jgi:hypothetical protein
MAARLFQTSLLLLVQWLDVHMLKAALVAWLLVMARWLVGLRLRPVQQQVLLLEVRVCIVLAAMALVAQMAPQVWALAEHLVRLVLPVSVRRAWLVKALADILVCLVLEHLRKRLALVIMRVAHIGMVLRLL